MNALRLGPIPDDKPVKLTIDVPPDVFHDLSLYAEAHAAAAGQQPHGPAKLIVPMLAQFMAGDREFLKLKRTGQIGMI
ncbi:MULTISPECIES: DUF2274 domain-containing protein [unclassified Sphingomonas]|uniref:DUF2274 domain-containing protein n=1 Tax=unclassified Sphingomonas TaxID=196159 RepID=UPI00083797D3|nr:MULTISPECIES: DUF2274 domain-containing protein [unclassified Sphingomonas]